MIQPVLGGPRDGAVIKVTVPDAQLQRGVLRSWLALGALGLGLLLVAVAVADGLARALVRPIGRLADTAGRLEGGELDARVRPEGPPEIREVGTALNRLAARIGELLAAERESVADMSHRLRTPVTALRLDAEALKDPAERRRIAGDAAEMTRMVDAVIQEARRPVREGLVASTDAAAVVRDRSRFWSVLAEDQERAMAVSVPAEPVLVRCSAEDLVAALDALLGNVFAHTPESAGLAVGLAPNRAGGCNVQISDEGPGLPTEDVMGRGASKGGSTGLGLDIARRTAEASGGRLETGRSSTGGAAVTLVLGPPLR